MKMARVDVTEELLVQALGFPAGTRIIGIRMIETSPRGTYELMVVSEQLNEVADYDVIPKLIPIFTYTYDKCGHVVEVSIDWRQGNGEVYVAKIDVTVAP